MSQHKNQAPFFALKEKEWLRIYNKFNKAMKIDYNDCKGCLVIDDKYEIYIDKKEDGEYSIENIFLIRSVIRGIYNNSIFIYHFMDKYGDICKSAMDCYMYFIPFLINYYATNEKETKEFKDAAIEELCSFYV